ncbi:hypothetical protein BDV95DRAFT_611633 [Massariosphaeria phaeospora]|uniref:Uncharacterized protein n=1 Tax=Massariosphaeria phaeospora TaxID=100035 RepID=A0A7C8I2R1_9PLEO|nr:hypothetical protein BDV95DRAFT_611633 [Massariosphaeria phaeospora]
MAKIPFRPRVITQGLAQEPAPQPDMIDIPFRPRVITQELARLQLDGGDMPLRLRVITPELARSHPDVDDVPLLDENAITYASTLAQLEAQVKKHLDVQITDQPYEERECNCAAAKAIEANAVLNELGNGNLEALRTLIVVHGNNEVAHLSLKEPTQTELQRTATQQLN